MNCLKYLIKNDLNNELDLIIKKSLTTYKESDGKVCLICGIKQGYSQNGFKKYYCTHLTNKIDNKLKKEKEKVTKKLYEAKK